MNISLNPKYRVYNELGCSFLICTDYYIKNRENRVPLVMLIPPYLGYMLSCFSGKDYDSTLNIISSGLNLSTEKLTNFIEKIIENTESFEYVVNGTKVFIPPSLLIRRKADVIVYNADNFNPLAKFTGKRPSVPLFMSIVITSKCQTDCIYCYADRSRKDDMSTERILSIIDEASREGVVNVNISGGDIFANKDWRLILERLSNYNYKPALSTKIPLEEEDVVFIKNQGVREMQLSIDSFDDATAVKILKTKNDYVDKVIRSLNFFQKHDMAINVKTVLTKYNTNIDRVSELFETLTKFECVTSWNLAPAFSSAFKEDYEAYRAEKSQLTEVYNYLKELDAGFDIHIEKIERRLPETISPFDEVETFVAKNKECIGNTYSMCVFSNGQVSICEMLYYENLFYIGDLNSDSIKGAWNSNTAMDLYFHKYTQKSSDDSPCYKCDSFKACKGSLAKKFCFADVVYRYSSKKWDYPDPRCPNAIPCDLEEVIG